MRPARDHTLVKMKVTYTQLRRLGACRHQLAEFKQRYPKGVEITEAACLAVFDVFNWNWAALYLLSAPALEAYNRIRAPAREDYNRAIASAREAYNRAKAYHRAKAAAQEAYNRAKASAFAHAAKRDAA